ncbi:MAG: M23/M56 family metallopeptidase [Bacteroidota bacterium]
MAPLVDNFIPEVSVSPTEFIPSTGFPILKRAAPITQKLIQAELETEQLHFSWLTTFYMIGLIFFLFRRIHSLFRAMSLFQAKHRFIEGKKVYSHKSLNHAFSLFNSIHIPKKWNWNIEEGIFLHEKEHVEQNHFVDVLLTDLACILLWFNPVIYLYKKSVLLNLEHLADQYVLDQGIDPGRYQALLLSMTLGGHEQIPLKINFSTPLKNRIKMMNKRKSNKYTKWSVLGAILIVTLLMSLNTSEELNEPLKSVITPITVVAEDENNPPHGSPIKKEHLKKISSSYGIHTHPIEKNEVLHKGVDMVSEMGTPVYATASGNVQLAEFDEKHGYFIKLRHSEVYQTQYSHLQSFAIMKGAFVERGQLIGFVGNSGVSMGPHLHYEVHKDGKAVDPKDYFNLDDC